MARTTQVQCCCCKRRMSLHAAMDAGWYPVVVVSGEELGDLCNECADRVKMREAEDDEMDDWIIDRAEFDRIRAANP